MTMKYPPLVSTVAFSVVPCTPIANPSPAQLSDTSYGPIPGQSSPYSAYEGTAAPFPGNITGAILNTTSGADRQLARRPLRHRLPISQPDPRLDQYMGRRRILPGREHHLPIAAPEPPAHERRNGHQIHRSRFNHYIQLHRPRQPAAFQLGQGLLRGT